MTCDVSLLKIHQHIFIIRKNRPAVFVVQKMNLMFHCFGIRLEREKNKNDLT